MRYALLAAMLVGGCSPGADAEATVACALETPNEDCASCAKNGCCTELAACTGLCRTFHTCLARCADDACRTECRTSNPTGYDANGAALASCLARKCEAACGARCGGYVGPRASCTTCIDRACCAVQHACMIDRDCAALVACERTCDAVNGLCLGDCERRYPAAVENARAFGQCVEQSCHGDCLPLRWRCLESKPPEPIFSPAKEAVVGIGLRDLYPGRTVLVGAKVVACAKGGFGGCTPVSAEAISNENGRAFVIVPVGFNGFFTATRDGGDGKRELDALLYLPMIRGDVLFDVPLLRVDDLPALAAVAGVALDATRGHLLLEARDCFSEPAPSVRYGSLLGSDGPLYVKDSTLDKAAMETAMGGVGGFFNVPPGPAVRVDASVAPYDAAMPSFNVRIEAGKVTFARFAAMR